MRKLTIKLFVLSLMLCSAPFAEKSQTGAELDIQELKDRCIGNWCFVGTTKDECMETCNWYAEIQCTNYAKCIPIPDEDGLGYTCFLFCNNPADDSD